MKRHLCHHKRLIILSYVICFCLLALVFNLARIQLVSTHDYQGVNLVQKAIDQRSRNVILDLGRGDILDRNGRSLTGTEQLAIVLLPKKAEIISDELDGIKQFMDILQIDQVQGLELISSNRVPKLLAIDGKIVTVSEQQRQQIIDTQVSGVFFVQVKERYTDEMLAKHVIGFIGEDPDVIKNRYGKYYEDGIVAATDLIGKSGLEYTYEMELRTEGATQISYYVYQDWQKNLHPYYGLGLTMQTSGNQYRPANLVTTIDADVQQFTEQLLRTYQVKQGAIVVLDVANGDVVAMASSPDFDPLNITMGEYELTRNRAVTASFPGSVFKTVIAIAALEEGIIDLQDQVECKGYLEFANHQRLKCMKEHGNISVIDAFANSCNVTFAQLAIKLGRERIIEYSELLGLSSTISQYDPYMGSQQLFQEQAGSIFKIEGNNQQLLANTGIGQQDVQITPLQAANMMVTIANFGKQYQPRIITALQGKNGHIIRKYDTSSSDTGIGKHTYYQLQKMLEAVATTGTAKEIAKQGISAAGKTGTAEIGKTGQVNRWFTGYYPAKHPKYAVAIVVENVAANENVGTPTNLFIDIAKYTLK